MTGKILNYAWYQLRVPVYLQHRRSDIEDEVSQAEWQYELCDFMQTDAGVLMRGYGQTEPTLIPGENLNHIVTSWQILQTPGEIPACQPKEHRYG